MKKKYLGIYTIAFLIVACIMFSWIWFWGFSITNYGDDIKQHYSLLLYLHDWYREVLYNVFVKHQWQVPMFEYTLGYGGDVVSTFSYYGILDPFYLLAAIAPVKNQEFVFWGIMIIRLYLCGCFYSWFCLRKGNDYYSTCLGAMVYCFSAFAIMSGFHQLMFLNCMFYLPIILIGTDKLFEKGTGIVFTIAIALLTLSSFYWCYMVVLLVIIYCILYYLSHYKFQLKDVCKKVMLFLAYGILGFMLAGIILVPAVRTLMQSARLSADVVVPGLYNFKYYCELLSHFFTYERNYSTYLGYIPIALVAIFVLFIQPNNKFIKIGFIILTLCFCIPYMGHVFNGFGYVSNRWGFGFSFLVAYIVTITYPQLLKLSQKEKMQLVCCTIVWSILSIINRFSRTEWALTMLVIMFIYVMLIVMDDLIIKRHFQKIIVIIMLISVWMNATYVYSYKEGNDLESSRIQLGEVYNEVVTESPLTLIGKEKDESTCRFDSESDVVEGNQYFVHGLGSARTYYSMGNAVIGEAHKAYGVLSPMTYSYNGLDGRSILEGLAGIKYYTIKNGSEAYKPYGFDELVRTKVIKGIEYSVYKNKYALPLAYAYQNMIDEATWEKMNFADKQETMLDSAVLENVNSVNGLKSSTLNFTNTGMKYDLTASDGITIEKNRIKVIEPNASITLTFNGVKDSETYVSINGLNYKWSYPGDDSPSNRYEKYKRNIDIENSDPTTMLNIIANGSNGIMRAITYFTPECEFYCGIDSFFCNLGYSNEPLTSITLTFPSTGEYTYDDIGVYCQPMESYRNKIENLQKHALKDIYMKGNVFKAKSNENEDSVICVALPYSDGWKAYVDGKETQIQKCNGMWIGVNVDKGKHQIVLKYRTPGLKEGIAISMLGLILLVVISIVGGWRRIKTWND